MKPSLYSIKVIDPKMRIFDFYGTAEVPDTQKEITRKDYLELIMPVFMDRGGPLMENHTNKAFGKALNYEFVQIEDENGEMVDAVKIRGKCFDNYESDDEIWNDIKSGNVAGFSWGGNYSPWEKKFNLDGTIELPPMGIYEWSVIRGKHPDGNLRQPAVYLAQLAGVSAAKMSTPNMAFDESGEVVGKKYDYAERLKRFGNTAEAVGWKSKEGQSGRFNQFAQFIKAEKSVLDVGAGLGHFHEHLSAAGVKAKYTGIDVQEEFVQAAKMAGVNVVKADVMEYAEPHDYVVASGTFNTQGSPSLSEAIMKMDALSKEGFGFNFLTEAAKESGLKAHNLADVEKQLSEMGRDNYAVLDGQVPGEKMVFVAKTKERIYLKPGEKPPEGTRVQRGPHGGSFYDTSAPESAPSSDNSAPSDGPPVSPATPSGGSAADEINRTIGEIAPKPKSGFADKPGASEFPSSMEFGMLDGIQDDASTKKLGELDAMDDRKLWKEFQSSKRGTEQDKDIATMAIFKRVHDQDDGTIKKAEQSFVAPDVSKWKEGEDYEFADMKPDLIHPSVIGAETKNGRIIVNKNFWENATPEERNLVLTHEAYHKHLDAALPKIPPAIREVLAAGRFQFPWAVRKKIAGKMGEKGPSWQQQGAVGYEPSPGDKTPGSPLEKQSSIKKESLPKAERMSAVHGSHRLGGKAMLTEEAKKASEAPKAEEEKPDKNGEATKEEPSVPEAPPATEAPAASLEERVATLEAQFQELMKSLAGAPSSAPAETPAEAQKSEPAAKASVTVPAKKFATSPTMVSTPRIQSGAHDEAIPVIDAIAQMPWQEIKEKAREARIKREAM